MPLVEKNSASKDFPSLVMIWAPLWFLLFLTFIGVKEVDFYLAKLFYLGNGLWIAGQGVWPERIIHQLGKLLPIMIGVSAFLLFLLSFKSSLNLKKYRGSFLYLVLCIVLCTLAVVLGKSQSSSFCPSALAIFGGSGQGTGKCFPAGHAGAAFCLFSLYFLCRRHIPKFAPWVFFSVFLLGFVFGLSRQMQGAHFLSHTLATLCLDWFICSVLYLFTIGKQETVQTEPLPKSLFWLIFCISAYWVLVYNLPVFNKILEYFQTPDGSAIWLTASVFLILMCGSIAAMSLFIFPRITKVVLTLLTTIAAAAFYFNLRFGTIINSEMVRNVLATDVAEASEFFNPSFFSDIAILLLPPVFVIWKTKIQTVPFRTAVLNALTHFLLFIGIGLMTVFLSYQGLAAFIRGEPVVRNLITPLNVLSSTFQAVFKEKSPEGKQTRKIIDESPTLGNTAGNERGVLFVVVVGETVRLQNWQLAGYQRDTNSELSRRKIISFKDTTSCGTSTDVSLPCMFSRIGRENYDRKKILEEESLLPLLKRAGANVYWIDNQSGCKGVCQGVEELKIDKKRIPSLCKGNRCFDEALLAGIDLKVLSHPNAVNVVFMHQLGNHGPAYYKRYPESYEIYKPVCRDEKLQNCSKEEIVNAYDNAIRYTDHFLSGVIDWLSGIKNMDTGLLYVSDHGESLGEKNMFLHGAPQFIAPPEQTKVPMFLWFSDNLKERLGLNEACMKSRAEIPSSHDQIFSTMLGILDVKSKLYEGRLDLTSQCRAPNLLANRDPSR